MQRPDFVLSEERRKQVREAQKRFKQKQTAIQQARVLALTNILRVKSLEEAQKIAEGALKDV